MHLGCGAKLSGKAGDLWHWPVYSAHPKNIPCFTNRTNSQSGPSRCINECCVLELMDLTSPVTRKVLRLWICSTEVQCQRVPVWSHIHKGKRFNSSLMGMLFMRSSLPVGRVIESGMPAGAEWSPWGPGDQCFDNKCLLLFGLGAWCLLCCSYCPLGLHDCVPCQKAPQKRDMDKDTHWAPLSTFQSCSNFQCNINKCCI